MLDDDSDFDMDLVEDDEAGDSTQPSLLTKTLVPSPIIKDIFEANLRAHDSQDIVFIKALPFPSLHSANA
jgi:hypothetical protein